MPDLGYGSHQTILAAAIAKTSGPILECGSGFTSTPLIHYAARGRFIVTADSDLDWLKKMAEGYAVPRRHEFIHVKGEQEGVVALIDAWRKFAESWAGVHEWGVAFVDHAPGEARVPVIQRLKGHARFILAHDCEADEPGGGGNYRWRDLAGFFKYETTMKRLRPWTRVYSDVEPFPLEPVDAADEVRA